METLIFPFCGVTSFFFKQSRTEELTRPVLGLGLRLPPFGRFPIPLSCGIVTPALKKTRALPNEKLSVSKKVIHSVLSGKVRQQAFGNTR